MIDKGENAPGEAWLRIFTIQRVEIGIEDVVVSRGVENSVNIDLCQRTLGSTV